MSKRKFQLGMVVNPEILAIKKLRKEDPSYTVRPSLRKRRRTF